MFYYTLIIADYEQTHTAILAYLGKVEEQSLYTIDSFTSNFIYYVNAVNHIHRAVTNVRAFVEHYKDLVGPDHHFNEAKICKRILIHLETQMHYKYIKLETPMCDHLMDSRAVDGKPTRLFCAKCKKEVDKMKLPSKLLVSPSYHPNFMLTKYTVHTFSVPSIILSMMQGNIELRNEKYISVWYMVRDILLYTNPFTIPDEAEFRVKYGSLLSNMSPLAILNHNAIIKTLRWISRELYTEDRTGLLALPEPPQKQLRVIQSILALC